MTAYLHREAVVSRVAFPDLGLHHRYRGIQGTGKTRGVGALVKADTRMNSSERQAFGNIRRPRTQRPMLGETSSLTLMSL